MIDYRLTEEIEVQAKSTPKYSTGVARQDSGSVVTNRRWQYALHEYHFNIVPGITDDAVIEEFRALFHVVAGMFDTFRFRQHDDYSAQDQFLGTGTGSIAEYQLIKYYELPGGQQAARKITRPAIDSVVVYFNGVDHTDDCTIDFDTGKILANATIGQIITVDFEFDVPVRLSDDSVDFLAISGDVTQPVDIVLEEDRE
jgi:uncharacterized protein (TIGR02217 family)